MTLVLPSLAKLLAVALTLTPQLLCQDGGTLLGLSTDPLRACAVIGRGVLLASGSPGVLLEQPADRPSRTGPSDGARDAARTDAAPPVDEERDELEERTALRSATPGISFGGSDVVVPAGEYHSGDLVSIGGSVVVDGEVRGDLVSICGRVVVKGTVRGDVVVIGGLADIDGTLRRDFTAVASRASLGPSAHVRGCCVNVAGSLERAPGARVSGEFQSIDFANLGRFASGRGLLRMILFIGFWVTLLATAIRFLGVLVVSAVASQRIEAALAQPRPSWILAFLLGFAVNIFVTLLNLVLWALCVSFPIAVMLMIATRVAKWMGLSAIYLATGRQLGRALFGRELSFFGSVLLGFFVFAVLGFIPFLGWLLSAILSVTGLGVMLLTRFGGARRPVAAAAPPVVPAPAAAS